ncbi:MAG TPA: hypothetical protein VHK89_06860 [Actinomycetota bacterium]|nr:hypothetical protein [Actinomycetota bacterium]
MPPDGSARSFPARVARHWRWVRTEGLRRLVEEDDLDPRTRIPNAIRKWWWRRRHGVPPGTAIPVYLVGLQRSGTNMLVRGLATSPEFAVFNENDRRAFTGFRLRPDDVIASLIAASRHPYVLFKPLTDSHRVDRLLDDIPAGAPGRALWAYRNVDGRARSAVAKFGDANLQALRAIAAGRAGDRWEAQRLSEASLREVARLDLDRMSPWSAAALFWYVRNSLFFELGLDRRPDVLLVSYDSFVAHPSAAMAAVCAHVGFPYDDNLVAHVERRTPRVPSRLDIDPRVRELCDRLAARLDEAETSARASVEAGRRASPGSPLP